MVKREVTKFEWIRNGYELPPISWTREMGGSSIAGGCDFEI